MAYQFNLPDIGEGLTEADIVRWVVPVGGTVDVDEVLVEVETAKAVVEMPSPVAGVVLHHGAAEGATLEVGAILCVIGESGEQWLDGPSGTSDPSETLEAPLIGTLSSDAEQLPTRVSASGTTQATARVLPIVRKLAKELGIELEQVVGSGPGGRITRDDVMAAVSGNGHGEVLSSDVAATPALQSERVRMSMLRRTIAGHMERSWSEIPHVTTFDEVDAARLLAARKALSARHGQPMPIEALVVKAAIPALRTFREFNATLDGDELILHGSIDVGIAVDTVDGLLVPVVRDAGRRGLLDIASIVDDLGARGKARTLQPDEFSGATFTISNIGAVGGSYGTPIIPHGTTAILSIGRAADTPVVSNGAISIAPMMPLSLSFDHRVIDGGMGRRFMAMLIENLDEPTLFLAD